MSPDWAQKAEPVPYAKMDDPLSLNLYSYVRNNLMVELDADGHQEERGTSREEIELEIREDREFYAKFSENARRQETELAENFPRNYSG